MSTTIRAGNGVLPAGAGPARGPAPIAYLGSSVTVQKNGGYRAPLHAALLTKFKRPHRPVMAGIGGVGSITALFMLQDLVLRHRPGLCFVEFATTDVTSRTPPGLLEDVLNEIVNRLRGVGCEPCFILVGRRHSTEADRAHVFGAYHRVAEARGVLCVDLAAEMVSDAGLYRDVVHTSERGGNLIAERVAAALGDAMPPLRGNDTPVATSLANAGLAPAALEHLARPEDGVEGLLGELLPYVSTTVGNPFEIVPEGELLGLVVAVGPTAGWVRVSGEGGADEVQLWDYMCHYDRIMSNVFERPRRAGENVVIEPFEAPIDFSIAFEPIEDPEAIRRDLRLIGYMLSP